MESQVSRQRSDVGPYSAAASRRTPDPESCRARSPGPYEPERVSHASPTF